MALSWRMSALPAGLWLALLGLAGAAAAADEPRPGIPWSQQRSGLEFQSPSTRQRQADLTENPGMLWVERGAALWAAPAGSAGHACQSCHGEPETLAGVAARLPAWDAGAGRLHSVETRIQACRAERQGAEPLRPESEALLSLSALVAHQSRGLPMSPRIDGAARPAFEAGRRLYGMRVGQLNLSCAQCHEQSWGQRLRSEVVSQGHGNGYPIYRLEWQTLGSLHRRLRSCLLSVRSEPPAHGTEEHLGLELYLAWRAKGLPLETPGVRR